MAFPFIDELLRVVPELRPVYDRHIRDNDTLLPHVLMGDVTRAVVVAVNHDTERVWIRAVLQYLEQRLVSGDETDRELVLASFVENLIGEPALRVLKPMMGARLRAAVETME